jgi:hypothetical protein
MMQLATYGLLTADTRIEPRRSKPYPTPTRSPCDFTDEGVEPDVVARVLDVEAEVGPLLRLVDATLAGPGVRRHPAMLPAGFVRRRGRVSRLTTTPEAR